MQSETNDNKKRVFDLGERTFIFAKSIAAYASGLPKSMANYEISRQLIRSGSSVGANYIEAEEALGKRDFMMRIKISRKEAKETRYWLKLSSEHPVSTAEKKRLIQEATELMNIFGSIVRRS